MIVSFRHKGLRRFYESGDVRDLKQDQVKRIRRILGILDGAVRVEDVGQLPGMRLHPLHGDLLGHWSLSVSGNWRIIFRFQGGHASDLDLVDYH